jgi:hypothetical protein
VTVKWMGMYQDGVQSIREAVDAAVVEAGKTGWYEEEDRIRMRIHESMGVPLTQKMLTTTKYSEAAAKQLKKVLKNVPEADPSGVSYADYSEDVGILKVSTFGPPVTQVFRSRVEQAMYQFAQTDKGHNKKLILDLRSNGGGDICLGYALHRYLFPTTDVHTNGHGPQSLARYDMLKSDLYAELAAKAAEDLVESPQSCSPDVVGYFTPCFWFYGASTASSAVKSTSVMVTNGDWMGSGAVSRTRGGVTADYSSLVHDWCEYEYEFWAPPGAGFGGIDPSNVILLSDGLCGSTCSVFSSSIQLTGLAKTVTIGGYHESDQMFWSFPGGQVVTIEFLVDSAQELGVTSANVPPILPDGATFRFAIREIYPWDTKYSLGSGDNADFVPLEFVYHPADYRIYYNSIYSDSEAVIEQVVLLFKSHSCPPKGYRSPVSGNCGACPPGSGVNALGLGCVCEYGVWDMTTESCEFDRRVSVSRNEVVNAMSNVEEVAPAATSVDASDCEQVIGAPKSAVIGVACTSFLTGIVATVVFFYVAVTRDEQRMKNPLVDDSVNNAL